MRKAARTDANHTALCALARDVGAEVLQTFREPGLMDVLIAYRGRLTLIEFKIPGHQDDLTEVERATIARLARVGVAVPVVTNADELLRAIGANEARMTAQDAIASGTQG